MTKLVVEELNTTLTQTFTLNNEGRATLSAIHPYIYMHNAPAGTFTFTLKSGADSLASASFDSAEIKADLSTSNNYAHLWKVLDFLTDPIQLGQGEYTLVLSHSGYTYSDGSFLGWVKEHENETYIIDGAPTSDFDNPLAFRFYSLKEIR